MSAFHPFQSFDPATLTRPIDTTVYMLGDPGAEIRHGGFGGAAQPRGRTTLAVTTDRDVHEGRRPGRVDSACALGSRPVDRAASASMEFYSFLLSP
jgi:hypothetical protein